MSGLARARDEVAKDGAQSSPLPLPLPTAANDGDRPLPLPLPTVAPASPTAVAAPAAASSSFRNVSACNRCRLRKNRCDQRLPSCASCDKASVQCVGYDPITKREIPRSYVFFLETRVASLETLLAEHAIAFPPAEAFHPTFASNGLVAPSPASPAPPQRSHNGTTTPPTAAHTDEETDKYDREKLTKLVSNIGMVSVQGASDPRYLGSTSGISFARVVFAAVKSSVSGPSSERGSHRDSKAASHVVDSGTSMRGSFFGLQTKPTIRHAPFPDRALGARLVGLYFEHANPQIPILHRGEFMDMFERVYTSGQRHRTSRESYMLNIVFAIGAGIILGSSDAEPAPTSHQNRSPNRPRSSPPSHKKRRLAGVQHQPEEYHASAIVHLETFLGSTPAADRPDGFGGGLEELQAVLLLAGFALLRPVAPGLWYIVGVAVRLGVDLGLHYEDGVGIDGNGSEDHTTGKMECKPGNASTTATDTSNPSKVDAKERGRRQWVRDLRRRLWWCVYSLDRLVSTCVGRPFGITDQVVTTEFPSLLDDRYITKEGFLDPPVHRDCPTYKIIAHHYFRLRLLQSEVLQVLQHRQAQQARASGANQGNGFMHTKLPSPFLANFDSFRAWRMDIDRRLLEWKDSAPTQRDAGVQFSPLFLELNYWQALIMLYRQSLVVPTGLQSELGTTNSDVGSPSIVNAEEREDEDLVFLKVAEAGQKVLKLYRQLHRVHLVNYTFLATHHLFMAGISFLFAVWHSIHVRSLLSLDDVDFTVLAATSVLGDLIDKCPPAEACRDAFDRMSKATIQMCMSTTGFGAQALRFIPQTQQHHTRPSSTSPTTTFTTTSDVDAEMQGYSSRNSNSHFSQQHRSRRPPPRFDMHLKDLFSSDETDKRSFSRVSNQVNTMRPPPPPIKPEPSHPQQQQPPFADLKISPQLRSHHHQQHQHQQPQQQQQQQQDFYAPSPNPLASPTQQPPFTAPSTLTLSPPPISHSPPLPIPSPYHVSTQLPYTAFAQNNVNAVYPDLGFLDFDVLDGVPVQGGGEGAGGSGSGSGSASASGGGGGASTSATATAMQDVGIGFGMGFGDGTHDWSDGNGFDLFDGFFFGPGGTGM